MTRPAYYNEKDKFAAAWLRELIKAGHIAAGDVDERSIEDVRPDDIRGYAQCHFFAGIGVWSYALRRAGWSDDRPVWTGSCPCQPFSAAGKGLGFADERHLWPHWLHLIGEHRPASLFGEQVASKDADPWIDTVQDDLEGLGYAVGAVPFPSAGVGAPHIRDRLYWVAHAQCATRVKRRELMLQRGRSNDPQQIGVGCGVDRLANSHINGLQRSSLKAIRGAGRRQEGDALGRSDASLVQGQPAASPTNGLWRDADWLFCRDGKWRPVEPGAFPLVDGAPARVGRLRGYGNAINAEQAKVFIEVAMECMP